MCLTDHNPDTVFEFILKPDQIAQKRLKCPLPTNMLLVLNGENDNPGQQKPGDIKIPKYSVKKNITVKRNQVKGSMKAPAVRTFCCFFYHCVGKYDTTLHNFG